MLTMAAAAAAAAAAALPPPLPHVAAVAAACCSRLQVLDARSVGGGEQAEAGAVVRREAVLQRALFENALALLVLDRYVLLVGVCCVPMRVISDL